MSIRSIILRWPRFWKAAGWGAFSGLLYWLLYLYSRQILELSVSAWWSPVVPITIAFAFSIIHGNFTSAFWDAVGIKPKSVVIKK